MGATTYRVMSRFVAAGEPATDALVGMPKAVFSTTLSEPFSWANTELVAGEAVEAVREMKTEGSKSMRTIGSLTLCRSLLNAGLVDRFRVVVFLVITGRSGRERIYDRYPDVALEMIGSRTFDGRIQLLEYVPTILAGPPGNTQRTRDGRAPSLSAGWKLTPLFMDSQTVSLAAVCRDFADCQPSGRDHLQVQPGVRLASSIHLCSSGRCASSRVVTLT